MGEGVRMRSYAGCEGIFKQSQTSSMGDERMQSATSPTDIVLSIRFIGSEGSVMLEFNQ